MNIKLSIYLPLILGLFFGCQQSSEPTFSLKTKLPAPALKRMSYELYGLDVKSKEVIQGTLGENEFMQDVLHQHQVDPAEIDAIEKKATEVFDVRRMRAGFPYTLVKSIENKVDFFIYEKSPTDFVVYDFRDTLSVYEGKQQTILREKEITGFIQGTLFHTIQEMQLEIRLAKLIEEIFAWSVDFSHLENTDYFSIIYEEAYVDEVPIGITRVLAAVFHHNEKDYYAFYTANDSLEGYFDEEGNSVERSFLKSPLKYTAENASQNSNPLLRNSFEQEYMASKGTPILSLARGEIIQVSKSLIKGKYIRIDHGEIYSTEYLNLGKLEDSLEVGKKVGQGDVIAQVGSNREGNVGSFAIKYWKNGRPIKPSNLLQSHKSDTLPSQLISPFMKKKDSYQKRLNKLTEPFMTADKASVE